MILTLILTVALMVLLFLSIWMATIFMPFSALAKQYELVRNQDGLLVSKPKKERTL